MTNNIAVTITADVADLTAKRAILSAELKAASRDLNDFAKTARTGAVTNELRAGMLSSAEAVAKARAQVALLDKELKSAGGGSQLTGFLANLRGGATSEIEAAASKFPLVGSALAGIGPAGLAAAAAIGAVTAAIGEGRKAADWAEDLKRTSDALGISTDALQRFDFIAEAAGIPVDRARSSLQGLAETVGKVQDNLVRGKQGAQVKVMELIFGTDDPEKAKADLRAIGGNLDELIPKIAELASKLTPTGRAGLARALGMDPEFLNSITEARGRLADLSDEAQRYGIYVDRDVVAKSADAAREMHVASAVIDADLRNAFLDVVGPIATASSELVKFIGLLEEVGGKGALAVGAAFGPLGFLASSVGHQVANLGRETGLIKPGAAAASASAAPAKVDPAIEKIIEGLGQTGKKGRGGGKGANEAREMADSDAQTQLAIQRAALEDQKAAIEEAYRDEIGSAQAKHDQLVAIAQQEAADEIAAQQAKVNAAGKDVVQAHEAANQILVIQADLKAKIDAIDRQLTEDKRREEEKRARAAREAAKESLEELKSNLATQRSIREIEARTAESQIGEKGKSSGVFGEVAAAQQIAALHRQTAQQALADDEAEHAAAAKLLQDDINAAKVGSEAYTKAVDAKKLADLQWANQHKVLLAQMVAQEQADQQKIAASWHSLIDPLVQTTGAQIKGLVEGTETWGQALRNIGEEALNILISKIEEWVEAQIVGMLLGKTQQGITAEAEVISNAAVAASAAYAANVGIPVIGPAVAEAAAATAFGQAAAWGSLASLDVGANVIPADMLAQVHAGERVIPAADNRQMMAAIERGTTNNRGGDFHANFGGVHINGGSGLDGRQVVKALEGAQGHFAKLLKGMHRNNKFAYAG